MKWNQFSSEWVFRHNVWHLVTWLIFFSNIAFLGNSSWIVGLSLLVSFGSLIYPLLPLSRFLNFANLITFIRVLIFTICFLLWQNQIIGLYSLCGVYIICLILDGLDGFVARKFGETEFGGLFDMEADNLFLTVILFTTIGLNNWWVWSSLISLSRVIYVIFRKYLFQNSVDKNQINSPKEPKRYIAKIQFVSVNILLLLSLLPQLSSGITFLVLILALLITFLNFKQDFIMLFKIKFS